uniref:cytochrome-b5 reductase n=1 Tax=Mucochytrium quahogii TaxID=96639 RepID=A0A7S2WM80_9STRA|mmetsp:Transcript_11707/g.19061  ORF Transcript_11707/g.19061 Transcript_11707/m.19061 type:complete len:409 (+) Transcript_11707:29-1255(+)
MPCPAQRRIKHICAHINSTRGASQKTIRPRNVHAKRRFTIEQLAEKREQGECWIAIHGKVYDITEFLEEHPGGSEIITDIDLDDFETINFEFDDAEHSEEALEDLEEFYRGKLVDHNGQLLCDDDDELESDDGESDDEEEKVLEANAVEMQHDGPADPFAKFQELQLPLIDKHALTHDVVVFRFGLPSPDHRLGLPIGQHIILAFQEQGGQTISRPYTPVSPLGEVGFIDFLIKLYPTGKMSQHISSLPIGHTMRLRGPKGKLEYLGNGEFRIRKKQRTIRKLGMIAGGSGITPMFQVLQAVASNRSDIIHITLLYANKRETDILLRERLELFAIQHPNIEIVYTLDDPPGDWVHYKGFITEEMIQATMPPPADDTMIFLCGPPPMIKKACIPSLQQLGYTREHYFKF